MKTKVYRIYVEPDLAEELNCAHYLQNSQHAVIESILTNPNLNINEDLFKKYCDEYTYSYMYYEECKVKLEQLYLGEIVERSTCNWNLNFATKLLTVTVDDDDNSEIDVLFREREFERVE